MLNLLKALSLLSPIKAIPLIGKTYFQGFYLLFGFTGFFQGHILTVLIPFLGMILFGLLAAFLQADGTSIQITLGRTLQSIALLGLIQAFLLYGSKNFWNKAIAFWAVCSIVLAITELFLGNTIGGRTFWGIKRFFYLVGEPNYSGFFFASLFLSSIMLKEYKWIIIWLPLTFLTLSRTPLLLLASFTTLYPLFLIFKKKFLWLGYLFLSLLFLKPFILYCLFYSLSVDILKQLINITTRFYLHPAYVEMFFDKPLGVGLGNAHRYFTPYIKNIEPFLQQEIGLALKSIENAEQHSLFLQILTETGILGYLCFLIFLFKFFSYLWKRSQRVAVLFLCFLSMTTTLNTLYEFGYYFVITITLFTSHYESKETHYSVWKIPFLKVFNQKL